MLRFVFTTVLIVLIVLTPMLGISAQDSDSKTEFEPIEWSITEHPYDEDDGDSFWLGIHKVRLKGVEAPEAKQPCSKEGEAEDCQAIILREFERLTATDDFYCSVYRGAGGKPEMSYNRYLATCYSDGVEVNGLLIDKGLAFADQGGQGEPYRAREAEAKRSKLGFHAFDMLPPAEFRKLESRRKCACD